VRSSGCCVGGRKENTRRDWRGHGLSTQVTSAVTADLLSLNLRTIVLNVREDNATAIRVYEHVGFQRYCSFLEAVATRQSVASPSVVAQKS
jgi:RimJ/RimL family protein N-acetyltransferase